MFLVGDETNSESSFDFAENKRHNSVLYDIFPAIDFIC